MPTFRLTNRSDRFTGSQSDDVILGAGGNDTLSGVGGDDVIQGQVGNDILNGGLGNDRLDGGRGADRLFGNDGNDTYNGGLGADVYGFAIGSATTASSFDSIVEFEAGIDRIALGRERAAVLDFLDDNDNGVIDVGDDDVVDTGSGLRLVLSDFTAASSTQLVVNEVQVLEFSDFIA